MFEGGGIKGIALTGALQGFEESGFEWQNLAGTSAGAITAALVAVGYTAKEIKTVMDEEVDFVKFMDRVGIGILPGVGPWLSLLFHKGMYGGDYFLNMMRRLLARKVGKQKVTFGDLVMPREQGDPIDDYEKIYKYKLQVIASDITSNEMLVLPQDSDKLGVAPEDLEVALAVRMSMSIPFFFRPVAFGNWGNRHRDRHWIVDGGILSNFPVWLFDSPAGQEPAWPTIGFLLWEPNCEKPRHERIRGPVSMALAMLRTMMSAHDRKVIDDVEHSRIVKIPTDKHHTTDFDLKADDRDWLYGSGYAAAKRFLEGWDFEQYVAQRMQRTL